MTTKVITPEVPPAIGDEPGKIHPELAVMNEVLKLLKNFDKSNRTDNTGPAQIRILRGCLAIIEFENGD